MHLILLSPEAILPEEAELVCLLFREGLQHYHVRKPSLDPIALGLWLSQFPSRIRSRMVLHQHHHLAMALELGGLHWKDEPETDKGPVPQSYPKTNYRSRSCHTPETALSCLGSYDALLLAPIFDPVSKPGQRASSHDWSPVLQHRSQARQHTRCIALGGITPARIPECKAKGFDGIAVLGALWNAPAPLATFRALQQACEANSSA